MRKLAVVLISVLVASAVLYMLLGNGLFTTQKPKPRLNIADVVFNPYFTAEEHCTLTFNSTHIVRTCWAVRVIKYVVLSNGEEVDRDTIWRKYGVSEANDTVVKVMDLRNRLTYAYEVIELKASKPVTVVAVTTRSPYIMTYTTEAPELGRVVKQLYNKTFTYKWLDVLYVHFSVADGANIYQFNAFDGAGITYYLASFIYFEGNNTLIKAPNEIAEATAKIIEEFYAKPISEVLGIPVKAVAVDPTNYCTWNTQPKTIAVEDDINCRRINKLDIVKVIYYVTPKDYVEACKSPGEIRIPSGCASLDLKTTYVHYRNDCNIDTKCVEKDTVAHEFGHLIGLGDLYKVPSNALNETIWVLAAWQDSIMNIRASKLSLLEFAHVAYTTWAEAFVHNKDLANKIAGRAIQYGLNISDNGVSLLVPTTNNELVDLYKDIAPLGVAELIYNKQDDKTYIIYHPEVLEIMKIIYKAATTNTPS